MRGERFTENNDCEENIDSPISVILLRIDESEVAFQNSVPRARETVEWWSPEADAGSVTPFSAAPIVVC